MQTAVDSQVWLRVEKVGGFMEQWKDQLQDTIRHWKARVDFQGTKLSLQDINRSTCEIPLEWNWKIRHSCKGNFRGKTAPWAYHDSFWFSNPPKNGCHVCHNVSCRSSGGFKESKSRPKVWRVSRVLFQTRAAFFTVSFLAVGPVVTHGGMPTTWRSKSKSNSRCFGGRGVAEWQWGWHLEIGYEDSGGWFFFFGGVVSRKIIEHSSKS